MVEIEGGEIVTEGPAEGYSTGLPYDIVIEKLHFGPERHNFHITDDALGTGGQKAKYQDNLAAIRTLTQIEAENRLATEQEQEVLSRSGQGAGHGLCKSGGDALRGTGRGCPDAF